MSKNEAINRSSTTEEESKNRQVTGILMALEGLIAEASDKISSSLALHDLGEETEFIKAIKEAIDNPMSNLEKSNDGISKAIQDLKVGLISSFAFSKKSILNFAAYSNEENATHFFIGLKEDTDDNRDSFYELLEKYEKYSMCESHPLIFHFVTSDMLDGVYNLKTISLDEQTPKSMSTK